MHDGSQLVLQASTEDTDIRGLDCAAAATAALAALLPHGEPVGAPHAFACPDPRPVVTRHLLRRAGTSSGRRVGRLAATSPIGVRLSVDVSSGLGGGKVDVILKGVWVELCPPKRRRGRNIISRILVVAVQLHAGRFAVPTVQRHLDFADGAHVSCERRTRHMVASLRRRLLCRAAAAEELARISMSSMSTSLSPPLSRPCFSTPATAAGRLRFAGWNMLVKRCCLVRSDAAATCLCSQSGCTTRGTGLGTLCTTNPPSPSQPL